MLASNNKYKITSHDVAAVISCPLSVYCRPGFRRRIVILLCFKLSHRYFTRRGARNCEIRCSHESKEKFTCDGQEGRQAGSQARQAEEMKRGKRDAIISRVTLRRAYLIRRVKSSLIARARKNSSRARRRSARYNLESRNENYFDTSLSIRTIARSSRSLPRCIRN